MKTITATSLRAEYLRDISQNNSRAYEAIENALRGYVPGGITLMDAHAIATQQMRVLQALNNAGRFFAMLETKWNEE